MGHLPGGLAGYTVRIVLWTVCPATRWSKPGSMGYCSVNLVDVGGLMKRALLWGCLTFCILLVACTVFLSSARADSVLAQAEQPDASLGTLGDAARQER